MRFHASWSLLIASVLTSSFVLAGCADDDPADEQPAAFSLRFAATAGSSPAGCGAPITGLGPDGDVSVGLADLRFYVSNIQLLDEAGQPVEHTFDQNDFQYESPAGFVALVDLTGNSEGSCTDSAIAFAEGTARTSSVVTGTTLVHRVAAVRFDVGVPQSLMKETIANNTAEGAPSPLNEMQWSWATGYRHLVANFVVTSGAGETGEGYLHIGSTDCGAEGALALEDRDACGFVNTPAVSLTGLDLETSTIRVDIAELLSRIDFVSPIRDPMTFEEIGQGPGVECHSSPMQPDCAIAFGNLGLTMSTGAATAAGNRVFSVQ